MKQLGIKYFRGIYSRDNLPNKIHKLETGLINLDDSMGGGSHWIRYRNVDKQYCEYFDPFGLIMPNEIKNYLKTSDKKNGVLIRWNTREGQSVVRLLVLVSPFGETKRETITRCYTQPQIQFYWSNDKSPISDKLFYVILLYNVWKVLCVLPRNYSALREWIWMYRVLHLWAPEWEWLWVR